MIEDRCSWLARLVLTMTAVAIPTLGAPGCRAGAKETSAAPAPAEAPPPAPKAEPEAAPAPAVDEDGAKSSGTPQALAFTGSLAGTMKDAGGGKRGLLSGCTKTDLGFTVNLLGVIEGAGKTPYGVKLSVLSYKTPRAYEVPKQMNLSAGANVLVNGGEEGKLPMGLVSASGTVTIDPGERHGSVDVDLKGGFGRPERGHLKGTWNCPPATN